MPRRGVPYVVTLHDAWWICGRQFMITGENRFCNQRKIDVNICATCVDNPTLNGYRQIRLPGFSRVLRCCSFPASISVNCSLRTVSIRPGFAQQERCHGTNRCNDARSDRQADTAIRLRWRRNAHQGAHLIKAVFKRLPHTNYRLRVVDNVVNLGRRSIDPFGLGGSG